jgi:hypothetical protein
MGWMEKYKCTGGWLVVQLATEKKSEICYNTEK